MALISQKFLTLSFTSLGWLIASFIRASRSSAVEGSTSFCFFWPRAKSSGSFIDLAKASRKMFKQLRWRALSHDQGSIKFTARQNDLNGTAAQLRSFVLIHELMEGERISERLGSRLRPV